MNSDAIGLAEIFVLTTGFAIVYITSVWSPLERSHVSMVALIGVAAIVLTIPYGLAYSKNGLEHAFLFGEGKAAVFFSWAFGLWLSLTLLRRQRVPVYRVVGWLGSGLYSLLLSLVLYSEMDLFFKAS
jgi:hypothetical protein